MIQQLLAGNRAGEVDHAFYRELDRNEEVGLVAAGFGFLVVAVTVGQRGLVRVRFSSITPVCAAPVTVRRAHAPGQRCACSRASSGLRFPARSCRLRAHWGKKVSRWKEKHPRIHLYKLPPYAPELNPIECAWGYLKYHELANLAPESETDLFIHAKAAVCKLRKRPDLLRSFLRHAPINFFAK